jgi:hypothetical protein
MGDNEVLIKVAADIASAVAALSQVSGQLNDLLAGVAGMQEQTEETEVATKSFWETWVTGAQGGTTASVLWGEQLSKSVDILKSGLYDLAMSFPNSVSQAANLGDELFTMSNRIGVSVEALGELRYIASQTGAPLEAMGRTIFDLVRNLSEGSDDFVKAIQKLGFTLEQLRAMRPEDAYFAILKAIQETVPVSDRAAVAIEIFGSKFRTQSMLLNEDISDIRDRFKELELGISKEFAEAGDKFNDALDDIRKTQEKWTNDMALKVLPTLTTFLEYLPVVGGAVLNLVDGLESFAMSFVPLAANIATIKSANMLGWVTTLGNTIPVLTARIWLLEASEKALALATWAAGTAFASLAVGLAAVTAAVTILYQAWKWWEEASARSSAAERQAVIDKSNLERINKRLGTSYTSLAEAVAAYNKQQKDNPPAKQDPYAKQAADLLAAKTRLNELSASQKAAIVTALEYRNASDVSKEFNVSELALKLLTKEVKSHADATKEAREFQQKFQESVEENRLKSIEASKELSAYIKKTNQDLVNSAAKLSDVSRYLEDRYTKPIADAVLRTTKNISEMNQALIIDQMTGIEKRFELINRAEAAEIEAVRSTVGISDVLRKQELDAIARKYADQRKLALKYTGDVKRDAEMRGIELKQELLVEYATEKQVLADMLKNREMFTDDAIKQQKRIVDGAKKAAGEEGLSLVKMFETVAGVVDQTSASLARLGDVSGNETLGKFAKGYQKASQYIKDGAAAAKAWASGDYLSAVIQSINLAINLMGDLWDTFTKSPGEKQAREVGRDFGVAISEAMGDTIAAEAEKLFGGDRFAASIYKMADIIKEAGGVTEKNFSQMLGRLRDVFSMIETGKFTVEQATQVLNENFDAFAAHVANSKTIVDQSFQEIFELNARFGTESEKIAAFLERQTAVIGAGLSAQLNAANGTYQGLAERVSKAKDEVEKLTKAQADGKDVSRELAKAQADLAQALSLQKDGAAGVADDLDRVGRLAVASFNAAIAKGADWVTAIGAIGPALKSITTLQENLGIVSNDAAVNELLRYQRLTEEHKGLFEAASGLNQVMVAMSSIGALNVETLADLEAQGLDTFEQLTAAGLSEQQALMQMKDWLVNVEKAHKDLGIPVDENTQKLLDQARAQGILKDEGMSTNDILIEGLRALIQAVGGDVPDAFNKMSRSAKAAAEETGTSIEDRVQDPIDEVDVKLRETQWAAYAERGSSASDDIAGSLGMLDDGFGGIAHQIETTDWSSWAQELVEAAEEASYAVDAVSLGHSPGGLKEIPLKVKDAVRSFRDFERYGVAAAEAVGREVDALSAASVGISSASNNAVARASEEKDRQTVVNTELVNELTLMLEVDPASGDIKARTTEGEVLRIVRRGLSEGTIAVPVRSLTSRVT